MEPSSGPSGKPSSHVHNWTQNYGSKVPMTRKDKDRHTHRPIPTTKTIKTSPGKETNIHATPLARQ